MLQQSPEILPKLDRTDFIVLRVPASISTRQLASSAMAATFVGMSLTSAGRWEASVADGDIFTV